MFGFLKRPAEVLDHWIAFTEGLALPPSEFYSAVEAELAGRKIPGLQITRLELPEGGLLSEKRTYLRLVRERLVFDVGAAPFGTGFFFSCRTAEIPLVLKPGQLLAVLLLLAFALWWLVRTFGLFQGPLLLFLALTILVYVLRNAVAMGLHDLDRTLVQSPLVGSVYEVFFRRETYHRTDARLCYLHVVSSVVKELAEHHAAAKGVALVRQFELSPVLGDLYKPVKPAPPHAAPPPPA